MKSFKKWLGIVEPERINLIEWKFNNVHQDLTEKQIVYLEQMISNHRNRGMNICHCDVQCVLDMCKEGETK